MSASTINCLHSRPAVIPPKLPVYSRNMKQTGGMRLRSSRSRDQLDLPKPDIRRQAYNILLQDTFFFERSHYTINNSPNTFCPVNVGMYNKPDVHCLCAFGKDIHQIG